MADDAKRPTVESVFGGDLNWVSNLPNMELGYTVGVSLRTHWDEREGDGGMFWLRFPEIVPDEEVRRRLVQRIREWLTYLEKARAT